MENCWRTGEYFLQISIKLFEHLLYHSQSPCTILRLGHILMAMLIGIAVFIPSFFAGMDAAVTMLLRSDGSPDTTEGISLISGPPSDIILTAVQLRKAEFTSIWKITRLNKSSFDILQMYVFYRILKKKTHYEKIVNFAEYCVEMGDMFPFVLYQKLIDYE